MLPLYPVGTVLQRVGAIRDDRLRQPTPSDSAVKKAQGESAPSPPRLSVHERLAAVCQRSRAGLGDLELWPTYYQTRLLEIRSIHDCWPAHKIDRVLEIGCGMGYVSALLAELAAQVVATDVPENIPQQHSIGMARADAFLDALNVDNVETQAVDAEQIPFDDDSFDMVFSMWVIQHIDDRERAAAEMARVLKPGGYAVHLVPSRCGLIYKFLAYWIYLAKRSVVHLARIAGRTRILTRNPSTGDRRTAAETVRGSGQFSSFPFQPVLGVYGSNREEWVASGLSQWEDLLSHRGSLRALQSATITLNPLQAVIGLFSPGLAVKAGEPFRRLWQALGRLPGLRHLGTGYLVILRKPDGPTSRGVG